MAKYVKDFLKGLPSNKRVEYQRMIERDSAYLERAADGSQYLIVIDPARLDEAIFARLSETSDPTCIGNRVR